MSESLECFTCWAKIYVAGPVEKIEDICREYVLDEGLCVTVTPTKYIYTGGEEIGAEVGLIHYPRFPVEDYYGKIKATADDLAMRILMLAHQGSYTIMMPDRTYFYSRRDEFDR